MKPKLEVSSPYLKETAISPYSEPTGFSEKNRFCDVSSINSIDV
jgi:hypothetical protein